MCLVQSQEVGSNLQNARIMEDYVDPKTAIDGEGLEEDGIRSYWIPKADESYDRELMKLW